MTRLLIIFGFLAPSLLLGQYGNEWIDYSQKYYEIPIVETGVYRIDSTTLAAVLAQTGDDLSAIDPRNLQLIGRDQELYIHVQGESDGVFNASDFLLFYAKKNDTWLDSNLFDNPDLLLNKEKSFTSDTIRYFLTWNNSINNRRVKQETDTDFSGYSSADYCWKTNKSTYHQEYFIGDQHEGLSRSKYEQAEGWAALRFAMGASHSAAISTANAYYGSGAPAANVEAVSAGASNASTSLSFNHKLIVSYTNASGSQIDVLDTTYFGYKVIRSLFTIPNSDIPATTSTIKHRSENLGQPSDYQTVGEVIVSYPHTFDFESTSWFDFSLEASIDPKQVLSITNFGASAPKLWLFSGDTIKDLAIVNSGASLDVLVPNNSAGTTQKLIMFDLNATRSVAASGSSGAVIRPVLGRGTFRDVAALNLDSAFIIVTHKSMMAEAKTYGAYRSSNAGGGFDTVVIDIDELYRQFGGGVVKSGIGIRRFCYYAIDNWPTQPSNLFLIGKSVMEASEGNAAVLSTVTWGIVEGLYDEYEFCLVPSIGYPSSDDYISKRNSDVTLEAAIPTGRLSAKTPQDVTDYYNKVIEYEQAQDPSSVYTIDEKEWQKKAMHFGGGATESEQLLLKTYLENYEETFENEGVYGGDVDTYLKVTTDPITPVVFDEVNQQIEQGVSLITFFGHASTDGFDQNIDNPDNWGNFGRYPVVLGLGCFAGDIHQPYTTSASEKFVVLPDQGAIAFLSTVKIGFTNGLDKFTGRFYEALCDTLYGESIGKLTQYSKSQCSSSAHISESGSVGNLSIQGDPAIRLNSHNNPELVLDESRVFLSPEEITVATDSIDVNIVVTNLGQAIRDTVELEVVRSFPNGVDSIYFVDIPSCVYRDTVVITMPLEPTIAEGINSFSIEVDLPTQYDEQYDEFTNNRLSYDYYMQLDGVEPIYPYDFAVVPNNKMTLKASTVDPFAPTRSYRVEVDTNDEFSSSFLKEQTIVSDGGVIEIDPDLWTNAISGLPDTLEFTDSTVYFWRTSVDSSSFLWKERSFQYIPGKSGWGQAHFHQFKNNSFLNIGYDKPAREFSLGQTSLILTCNTINNMSNSERKYCNYFIGSDRIDYHTYSSSAHPNIHVCVIDPITLEPWGTPKVVSTGDTLNWERDYGQRNVNMTSRDRPDYFFEFRQTDPAQIAAIEGMIDTVPDGHYILIYTIWKADYSYWDANAPGLYSKLVSLGSDSMAVTRQDESFIFFCRKGDPTSANEVYSQPTDLGIHEPIQLQDSLNFAQSGLMTSQRIGPALKWNTLYWAQNPYELPNTDSTRIKLYGIKTSGIVDLILDSTFTLVDSIINLDLVIDAQEYPYAKVEGFYYDGVSQTPAQTQRWQLLYDPVPELAINKKKGFYFSINDSIAHGDSAQFAIAIENVSEFDFDSLLVHYYVQDYNNVRQYISYPRQDSLRAGEVLLDTITISTVDLPEDNRFWVEANPYTSTYDQDQNEQYYFNNVAFIDFHTETDKINPILDVTFDGLHIMDREIVSAKPFVTITLDDENPFFLFDSEEDTSNFQIFLLRPGATSYESLRFRSGSGEELLRFIPATGSDNKCTIEYEPEFTKDGIYKLLVQAKDKSQNASGDIDYEIEFEVVTASTITEVMNYPNPFTTRTQFVFTLTGSEIPDYFNIKILTASGRIVREISREELGTLRIGRNITDYYWDGRDQFGDRLAAGVYFYTVTTKINGQDIDLRPSGADQYINKEFGKMYLLSY
ncbi:MAG: hypothetical protein CL833_02325 [Crocinitomicaceae bacterium]|nr:hypothetical protein [Crocinitomicaceae bacterium]